MPKSTVEYPSDHEMILTRSFDAPRELVWEAHTNPRHVVQWWGPRGFTNTIHEMNVRPGGLWRLTMHAPDGTDYPNRIEFIEVEAPERLVYHHGDDANPRMFHVTTRFVAEGSRTTVISRMLFRSRDERDQTSKYAVDGHNSTMDRLGDQLTAMQGNDREIVLSRVFDAPRELVWQAMTDPRHVGHWWGPRGFTTTTEIMDVRPGGVWRHVMHGPDGVNYPNKSVFKEVVAPERIVYSHGGGREDGPGAHFIATWTFEALTPRKTRLTIRMVFPSSEDRNLVVREFGAIEGAKQTLARLAEHLPRMQAPADAFVIARVFDAPRELMFDVWTQREHLQHWWGPQGLTLCKTENDLRPGGKMHFCMRSPDGHEMWGRWIYREIVKPERIVVVNSFSDPQGGLAKHPMAQEWPAEMLNTITFTEHEQGTLVTVVSVPLNASDSERGVFGANFDSMRQGWGGTLAKLGGYLASRETANSRA